MDTELSELSVSEIGSRSRDRSISLDVTDANLTQAGELKIMRRETSRESCCKMGDKRAFLDGANEGVCGLATELGVLRTGCNGLDRQPRSARPSASLFPSTDTCEGTLTHRMVFPCWLSSWRSSSQMATIATRPRDPFQPRIFYCFAAPDAPKIT